MPQITASYATSQPKKAAGSRASRTIAIWQSRQVLNLLVGRDLKVKYQSSLLGYAWSLLEPLALAGIYFFVFGLIFNTRALPEGVDAPGGYILYLIAGILPWMWFSTVLSDSTRSLMSQAKLITTMKVPREIFPLATVCTKGVEYLLTLPILALFALGSGGQWTWNLLYLPLAVVLQFVFLLGVALLLSSITVVLRDVQRIMRIVSRVLFYATPLLYPAHMLLESDRFPEWFKVVYEANPIVGIIELHHAVWFPMLVPPGPYLASTVVGTLLIFALGWWTFRRLEPAVLKEL
ncbi:ABC transporter permease [Allonocardiopsis opalescens]|uniref:Transport permease protein n=1 Tax=Allonocardiopsis opalescens TaxID=1144618 RepID=A0A2T0QC09_9ACTN|nr:ABC transporter permease [Allonocardiopsis opalescens]PRY01457.1 ABC-2 type transport system permease protein [Allonocardiopsis opalescens]